jgi:cytoskeletal protein RodZ
MNFWSWLTRTRDDHGWPGYLINGRIRTSTVGLIVAFVVIAWVQNTYRPPPAPPAVPDTAVVPPGFVPDPEYTWVPRTNVQERPRTTSTTPTTTTTTPTTTEPSPTDTTPTSPTSPTSPTTPTPVTVDPDGAGPIPPQTLTPITIPSVVLPTLPGLGPAPTTPAPPT